MKDKPFTWSPSALKSYGTCPRQYWYKYWNPNTVKGPDSEAMIWGKDVHTAFELAVKHDHRELPARFKVYQKWHDAVRSIPGIKTPEQKVAFNRFWEEVDFFAPDAWLRLIVDLTIIQHHDNGKPRKAVILDYKTGKSRYDNNDQLKLSSIQSLVHPTIETMQAGYIYLKEDKSTYLANTREGVENYKQEFEIKVEPVAEAVATTIFKPKPSGLCKKWCDDLTCPHNGKR